MNKTQLKKSLHELLQQSRGDKQVSSCYLDTEQGIDACGEWLGQQLARGLFHAYDAQGKDSLIASLKQAINENWDPKAKSLALFWSLGQGSSLLFAIPLPLQISNRISVYRQPDIRPILPLLNAESNLTILAYRSKQMQVFDVNLGQIRPVAWALAPHLASPYYTSQNEPRGIDSDKRLKLVCLSLINSKHKPLMLAASSEDLAYLRQWLPRPSQKLRCPRTQAPSGTSGGEFPGPTLTARPCVRWATRAGDKSPIQGRKPRAMLSRGLCLRFLMAPNWFPAPRWALDRRFPQCLLCRGDILLPR